MKKLLFFLLCLLVAAGSLAQTSGTTGDCTWSFDSTSGLLTISGNGAMANYYDYDQPWYSFRTAIQKVVINQDVKSIGDYVFIDCTALTSVTIGNSVTSIGIGAFWECTDLTAVTIGNSVTSIGINAFFNCRDLTDVTIPNSVKTIGEFAFLYCSGLTDVTIPNSVTTIGQEAFFGCTGLISLTIGNSVTTIGQEVFAYCTGLRSVNIGNSVTTIGEEAFAYCTSLTSVTIPNSVTTIGNNAFSLCRALTSVSIGNSVTTIGYSAFNGCSVLAEIHNKKAMPQSINSNVFQNVNIETCILYVPKGAVKAYRSAEGWNDFRNIIEEEDVTAINTISNDNVVIHSTTNGIAIATQDVAPVVIFNLSGQTVYQAVINGRAEIALSKGVYIVKVGKESHKIIVP